MTSKDTTTTETTPNLSWLAIEKMPDLRNVVPVPVLRVDTSTLLTFGPYFGNVSIQRAISFVEQVGSGRSRYITS